MNDQLEAWTTHEGKAKVASLTLIGRGVSFSFRKIEDNFVLTVNKEDVDVFTKEGVHIVRPGAS